MLRLLGVIILVLACVGCQKTLHVKHTWPDKSVTEMNYTNRGFNTTIEDLQLQNGETKFQISKYNAETKAYDALIEGYKFGGEVLKAVPK